MGKGKGTLENMGIINKPALEEQSFWRERKVFVTGATGMVGSWLIKELIKKGANIFALIRDTDPHSELFRSGACRRVSIINGCVEDYQTLERAISENAIETVFHLAAQAIVTVAQRSPLLTFETNIRGTYNLLEACRIHQNIVQQVVVASSDKAYGTHIDLPYQENMALGGRHPYEVSKSCTDLLAQSYFYSYGLPVGIVRCGNIYGGGDLNWSRIIPGTIRSLLKGEAPIIRSDGKYVRDYIYVKDVVNAYMRIANNLKEVKGSALNISNETPISVVEIVNIICRLMKLDHLQPQVLNQVKGGEIISQYLSSKKAKDLLNWRPEYSLANGLVETIDWYKNFFGS